MNHLKCLNVVNSISILELGKIMTTKTWGRQFLPSYLLHCSYQREHVRPASGGGCCTLPRNCAV